MAAAETARLVAELSLKDKMTPALKKAGSSLSSFDKATSNTQKSLSKFGSNIGKGIAIGAGAIAAGGVIVVKAAADYEQAFAGVRKTVDATEPQLQKLSDGFRQMAKEIPISASELAALGEAGGALGIAATDLEEFVRVTALLGQTTNITAEDAATSLGVLSNVLHLTSDEYSKFASALVALGNAGASTEADIISIAERAGAAGELIGVSTEGVLAFSSSIASLGIEAEAGGTALQRLFIKSAEAVAEGGKGLKTYAKVAGKSAKDFKKAFEKDAGGALQDFLAGLGKLTQGEQIAVLKDLGLSGANLTRVLLGLGNNAELLGSQIDVANTAFEENTALTKEAAERNKTFSSQMQITKNVLNDIAITIGSKLLPKLVPLLQQFNKFVSENQGQIEKFGDDLATAFSDIATAVGKTDWTPFIDGLRLSAELAKGAFNAFNALPDDFKKLILVGAGVNKITGGLLTSHRQGRPEDRLRAVRRQGLIPGQPAMGPVGGRRGRCRPRRRQGWWRRHPRDAGTGDLAGFDRRTRSRDRAGAVRTAGPEAPDGGRGALPRHECQGRADRPDPQQHQGADGAGERWRHVCGQAARRAEGASCDLAGQHHGRFRRALAGGAGSEAHPGGGSHRSPQLERPRCGDRCHESGQRLRHPRRGQHQGRPALDDHR